MGIFLKHAVTPLMMFLFNTSFVADYKQRATATAMTFMIILSGLTQR